ncbi:hypothetical protein H114_32659 [Streptomyces gancidicus BKS 13-15]|uniref:Uncharacterized protein n=1 Tax=Streptomyces gancidicus BKS 13-15 TaxID=1284664 RepID=M3C8J9_STREZ|nr:hypothetical protein [Streptomyces gancidicus]EMF20393.1 hypothetical protein H114_32659 [Streptomyces gancidicus BKS 13-15]
MTVVLATACDTTECLALHVGLPGASPDFERTAAARAGWDISRPGGPHYCPACSTGRGPVLDLGDCERCHGRRIAVADGERCLACGHLTPCPHDER